MKKLFLIAACVCLASMAFAQAEVMLDDLETTFTGWSSPGTGYGSVEWLETDGADGSAKCVKMDDGGWTFTGRKTFTGVVPSDGDYKITFYYKNGAEDGAVGALKVKLNQQGTVDLGSAAQTTWTASETGVVALTTADDVVFDAEGSTGATAPVDCQFDQIKLVEVLTVPITMRVTPPQCYYISGTQTIEVEPQGGSGTYTQAEFDLWGDSSVDYTDNTPGDGLSYDWDVSAEADGATSVVITVTDDASATGQDQVDYTIANLNGGRQSVLLNGDFENWTGALPDDWSEVNFDSSGVSGNDANTTVSKETADVVSGSNALKIEFAASDYGNRYTMLSNSFNGYGSDYILWYWGKGGSDCRMAYFYSDDEVTWEFSWYLLASGSGATQWAEVTDACSPWAGPGAAYCALATHKFSGSADGWWDDIVVTATMPPAGVTDWDLY